MSGEYYCESVRKENPSSTFLGSFGQYQYGKIAKLKLAHVRGFIILFDDTKSYDFGIFDEGCQRIGNIQIGS